jgi:hypothetical protein
MLYSMIACDVQHCCVCCKSLMQHYCVSNTGACSVQGFTIVDSYEGPGTWFDVNPKGGPWGGTFGSQRTVNVATDQYGPTIITG